MSAIKHKNRGASDEAIQHHYDVSNDFYFLWLDPTRTYSSALWKEDENYEDLEAAQLRKLDFHVEQARVKNAKRVLDVGCGWGSLLRRLVDVHGVEHTVGLTLSKAQLESVATLNHPKIEVRLESWTEHFPTEPYDGIISIGAFEHFARLELRPEEKVEAYRTFFRRCHELLKPGSWMSLQTIVYENSENKDLSQFFAEQVFPESDLPRQSEIFTAADRVFEIIAFRNNREHYARTLKAWLKRLKANRTMAVNLVGEEEVARYEKYLSLSIISMHTGATNLSVIALRRLDNPRK
jgi:cyclopropane-fatty-acyl-phospholipid synthase